MPFHGDPRDLPPSIPWLAPAWGEGSDAIRKTLKRAKTARRLTPGRRLKLPYEVLQLTTDDGVNLNAWYLPAEGELAVVLHHHYGGQKATVLPWLAFFHELGLPALAFDARGHADSDAAPKGRGSFVRRAADVQAACDELRRRGHGRILGFGQSQGAASLVIGAAGRPDVVGVILDSGPAPEMGTAAWGLAGNMLGRRGKEAPGVRGLLALRIVPGTQPVRYLGALWRSLVRLRSRPLLWIHGGRDDVIERGWSAIWFRALRAPGWEAVEVPEADHVRTLQVGGESVRAAVRDFVATLGR